MKKIIFVVPTVKIVINPTILFVIFIFYKLFCKPHQTIGYYLDPSINWQFYTSCTICSYTTLLLLLLFYIGKVSLNKILEWLIFLTILMNIETNKDLKVSTLTSTSILHPFFLFVQMRYIWFLYNCS